MSNTGRFGLVALALAVAVVAFLLLRPSGTSSPPQAASPGASPSSSGASPGSGAHARPLAPKYTTIDASAGGGDPMEVKVAKGDTVRLAFTSNAPAEVHIHGYERELAVKKGQVARTSFPANLEGVFEIENHKTDALVAKLRVEP